MAGGKTQTHEAGVLNVFRATALGAFTPYVGLYSVTPSDSAEGTEVAGGSYARGAVTFSAPTGGSPSSMTNSAEILISMPTVGVVAVAIHSASSGTGNMKYWVGITTVNFTSGDQARFAASALTITEE